MLLGHLDSIALGVTVGTTVKEGRLVGTVGDRRASPTLVHLHLEVRRVREGVDLAQGPAGMPMIAESVTVVCDPRNVLPLRRRSAFRRPELGTPSCCFLEAVT